MMVAAVFLLFLVPQVFFWGSQSPFLLTKALYLHLAGAFACLAMAFAWFRDPARAGLPRALLAPALFVGYAAARGPWLAETYPEMAAPFLWGALLLVSWPTAAAIRSMPEGSARCARLLVLLGALTAVYALLQGLGLDFPFARPGARSLAASFSAGAGRPPFATLGNPNYLAEYLAALLPLAAAGAMAGTATTRWAMGGGAVLISAALPLTLARGAWVGAGAGLVVMLFLRPRPGAGARRGPALGLLVLVPALAAAAAIGYLGSSTSPWQKLVGTISHAPSPGEGRRLWWTATAEMVADRPLAGVGEGRFREAYPPYQARALGALAGRDGAAVNPTPVESPHNDYLHVAADLGIPGLLLLMGALAPIVWHGARGVAPASGDDRAARAGSVGGLVAILVAALFGYPLHTASGLFLASALSALAVAADPRGRPAGPPARWQWILLAGVTAFGFWQASRLLTLYAASLHLHRGTEAFIRGDRDAAIEAFERAHQVSPRDSEVRVSLGRALLAAGRPDLALPHLQAGLHGFDAAPLRFLLGRASMALGQLDAAEESFRVGASSFPGYPPLHLAYGALLAGSGRDAQASRELARALERDPTLAEAHYLLAMVRSRQGDAGGAGRAASKFLELARPGDPRRENAARLLRPPGGGGVDNGGKPVK
ncbi:MAG TPA: O-antigen ligase family protein [Candidatus Methylomirabilis sp.]|jgi:tetratricopeptide (TPR) repeat protein